MAQGGSQAAGAGRPGLKMGAITAVVLVLLGLTLRQTGLVLWLGIGPLGTLGFPEELAPSQYPAWLFARSEEQYAQLVLGLERHHQEVGSYPARLADLSTAGEGPEPPRPVLVGRSVGALLPEANYVRDRTGPAYHRAPDGQGFLLEYAYLLMSARVDGVVPQPAPAWHRRRYDSALAAWETQPNPPGR